MIKKLLAVVLVFIVITALFLLSAAIVFKAVFTEKRIKRALEDGVRGVFYRELAIEKAKNEVLRIKLENLSVSERPKFGTGEFLRIKKLALEFCLFSEKSREPVSLVLKIHSPAARLKVKNINDTNVSDVFGIFQKGREKYGGMRTASFLPSRIIVDDAEILITTPVKDLKISGLNAEVSKDAKGRMALKGKGDLAVGNNVLAAEIDALFDLGLDELRLNSLSVADEYGRVVVEGSVSGIVEPDNMVFDIEMEMDGDGPDILGNFVSLQGGLSFAQEHVEFRIKGSPEKLEIKRNKLK
ncbi:MAG: hypothetical protein JW803_06195 [Endomicrobiales bacterium]|nr:hypothetical protein [Endomicrobiales bacterium]